MNGLSVIVCCYNSAYRLPETLRHLALQETNFAWELIIVDNLSIDDTVAVAEYCWKEYATDLPLQIVPATIQGLSHAREKGVTTANYEILIFCDDDNWLDKNYLQYAFDIMQSNASIGILGGRSEGAFEITKPAWFDRFGQAYAIGRQFSKTGIANARTFIAGAGMVTRKSLLEKLKSCSFNFVTIGRTKSNLLSGDDAELSLAMMYMGYDLYYDERLYFIHYMTAQRLHWPYCVRMMSKGHAIPQLYLFFYDYCYKSFSAKQTPEFEEAYQVLKKQTWKDVKQAMFHAKPFWLPLAILLKTRPGSRKEIYLKANLHKSIYLLRNKQQLRKAFYTIRTFLQELQQSKLRQEIKELQSQ
ncbi:MAG: glycosyltransferase [Chitinophagaceae bacterium]